MLEELQVEITNSSDVPFWMRIGCARRAASLAECWDLCEWFGVSRIRAAIHHWYQSFAEHYDQSFTADPDRVAIDEKQIQLENKRKVWLYAAIDVDSKVLLHARLSRNPGTKPATTFLRELKEEHRARDAKFLVDGMSYLTALAKTDLFGDLNYSDRNIVEKLFQTYTMRLVDFMRRGTAVSQAPSAG